MTILDKNQVEIEIKKYKTDEKIKVVFPDEIWAKYHFNKAEYNLRIARINLKLNDFPDFLKKLEKTEEADLEFDTHEWVIIMSYYAMFHSVNAILRKIGIKTGKEHAHEITTNLLLYYFYYTKVIEEELLKNYEDAEKKAKEMIVSYISAKEERIKYQYKTNIESQEKEAEKVLKDAVEFVSKLKDMNRNLSREIILFKLGKKSL